MATTKKPVNRKANQAKVISDLQNQLQQEASTAAHWYNNSKAISSQAEDLQKQLTEAQIAVLDSVAIIRYLEKKVFDLMKGIQK